jgi:hypothetical protein
MRLSEEAEDDGNGDVRVTDAISEPIGAFLLAAAFLKQRKGAGDLLVATGHPYLRYLAVKGLLIVETDGLFP